MAQAERPVTRGIAQFSDADWAADGIDGNNDGVKDVWDPADAVPAQGRKMCELLRTAKNHPGYRGTPLELALAGYRVSWSTVEKYGGVPRASGADGETYDYVKAVMKSYPKMVVPVGGDVSGGWTLPVEGPAGDPVPPAGFRLVHRPAHRRRLRGPHRNAGRGHRPRRGRHGRGRR